jgi:hypothetical protein
MHVRKSGFRTIPKAHQLLRPPPQGEYSRESLGRSLPPSPEEPRGSRSRSPGCLSRASSRGRTPEHSGVLLSERVFVMTQHSRDLTGG